MQNRFKKDEVKWLVGEDNLPKVQEVTDVFYRSDYEFSYKFITTRNVQISYYYQPNTVQVTIGKQIEYFSHATKEQNAKDYINEYLEQA